MHRSLALIALSLVLGLAPANPLLAVTPDTAAIVLEIAPAAGVPSSLIEAFDGLGWETHLDTLMRVGMLLDSDLMLTEDPTDAVAALLDEVVAVCPALADALPTVNPADLFGDSLLSIHLNPFNPVPQLLAITRPADPDAFAAIQDAVIGCFGGTALDQDGVALNIVFDGTELPLVLARHNGYFFAASDPNLSRWVVRQLAGAGERSLANAPLGQALERLSPGGWGIGADLGSLAQLIDLASQALPPEFMATIDRLQANVSSIGAIAARIAWDAQGLRAEGVQYGPHADASGALHALLHETRSAPIPPFLPQGSVALSSQVIDWNNLVDAVDELLVPLGEAIGESLSLRLLATELLGFDLDRAWLAWAGDSVQTVTLAPLGTDLRGWLQGAPTLVTVPVLDEAAARAALPELIALITTLGNLVDESSGSLMGLADPFSPTPSVPLIAETLVTRESVDGVIFDRIRFGPTFDLGLTVLDGHLLAITPMRAARAVLQHRDGFGSLQLDPAWAEALQAWPQDARNISVRDTQMELWALSDVADLFAQPLAWLLQIGLHDTVYGDPYGDDEWMGGDDWWMDDSYSEEWWLGSDGLTEPASSEDLWAIDLASLRPAPLVVGYTVDGQLTDEDSYRLYDLLGGEPGMIIEVEMLDPNYSIDTFLYVLNADTGKIMFENDDAPTTDRSFIAFMMEPGIRYQVLASSYGGWQSGSFVLTVNERAVEADGDASIAIPEVPEPVEEPEVNVDIPSFGELLAMVDLLPRSIDVIADASGLSWSVTRYENGMTVTRIQLPLK